MRPLQVLWVTPLRALASDTARALRAPIEGLGLDWQVGLRSGDASSRERRLAREGRIDVLVTTPESLALLLSYPDTLPRMRQLRCVVVDEWHELLGSKRGVLLQLNLAVLRDAAPEMQLWGLSATLGNLQQAREVLLPGRDDTQLVQGVRPRPVKVRTLLPKPGDRFPWAGHLGLAQLHQLRGRVGRGSAASHCVLLYHPPLSQLGRERLAIMRETCDGFLIAEKDLELRGPGEMLGTRQTGLLQFKVADLMRDAELLPAVRDAAQTLLARWPQHVSPLLERWLRHGQEYGQV